MISASSSISATRRTSTTASTPGPAATSTGQRLAHSIASSWLRTWISMNPAISSFDSVNGPSTIDRFPSRAITRAPAALGVSPSAASRTPARCMSSLNLVIASMISSLGWPSAGGSPLRSSM